jgi:O-antigen ligase
MILGVNPENIFTVSRNFISVLMLMILSGYFVSCEKSNTPPSLSITLFSQLPFLYGIGRAGIISGALLLIIAILSSKNKIKTYSVSTIILTPILFFLLTFGTEIDALLTGIERFERLGGGGQRSFINEEYISLAIKSPTYILFGAPLSAVQAIIDVDGNPHNSFIRLHISFGIVGVISTAALIIAALIMLSRKGRNITALVLIIVLFRSAVDSAAFYGPLDFVIIYCILEAFATKSHSGQNIK